VTLFSEKSSSRGRRCSTSARRIVFRWLGAVLAWGALLHQPAAAGGGPESIFLVVNSRGDLSKEVANHYIALRNIPPNNVYYIPAPPNARIIGSLDFREKTLRPILAEIEKRGLRDRVDQIVYSCEFPYQINFGDMFPEDKLPQERRPVASLTGATYLYQFVEESSDLLTSLNTNLYFAPQVADTTVTRAFHRRLQWSPSHAPVLSGGIHYVLATALGVKDAEANTGPEMIAYLKRAAAADGTRPPGAFYYMKNDDVRSTVRDRGFAAVVAEIRALGLHAEIGNGIVPNAKVQLLGLTTGSAHVALRSSGSQLAPGALVDNLTSAGAVMAKSKNPNPQTRISEYLRLGAAGASGTVIEPLAIPAKFPSPALHVHYARGCCMAEAFFQSVQGPYQLLIVGDPLCQPWAKIPAVTPQGIADGQMISGQVSITPTVKLASGQGISVYDLYVDGKAEQQCTSSGKFDLDTTKLADGYHELRIVAVDDSPIETQGRWLGGVTVKNGRDAVSLTAPAGSRVTAPQLTLAVTSTVEGTTVVWHNGRELGRVTGKSATLQVPVEKLGKGPVVITASTLGAVRLCSQPLQLDVQ
jgi:uncharacterized protein (TIGR03790 family)